MNINKLVIEFLKENKVFLLAYIVFMISYPISSVVLPKYYSEIIDNIKENKHPNFKKTILIFLANNSMFLILDKIDTIFMPKLQSFIRKKIVDSVLNNHKNDFEEQKLGLAISQIIKLPIVVKDLARQIRNYVVPIILIFISVVVRIFSINKKLGAYNLILLLVSVCIVYPMFINVSETSLDLDEESDNLHENISEMFDNMMDIYSMETLEEEINNLDKYQDKVSDRYRKTYDKTNILRIVTQVLSIVVFVGTMIYAYKLFKQKEINNDSLVSIFLTSLFVIKKISSFAGELPDFVFNLGTYKKVQQNLSKLSDKVETNEKFEINRGDILFDNVNINYADKNVIKNFSLHIQPKESIAILGKIGSGKSSLIKSLLKLVKYDGDIYIDGKNTNNISTDSLRSQILFIRQNPLPFNRTIYENIVYGTSNVSIDDVDNLFKKYNLYGFFNKKLDSKVGRKGDKLSGGQRMIMFLLRILVQKNKKVIILDEPTSSLDDNTSNIIISILKDIIKNQTTIIITHDRRLNNLVDRVINLK
jgi:ABC-type multidrug transport system fused ATPase/permease subunit